MKQLVCAVAALLCVGLALTATPSKAQGYGYGGYHGGDWHHAAPGVTWTGRVDDTINIWFQGSRSWMNVVSGRPTRDAAYNVYKPIPQDHPVDVYLTKAAGRGSVYVFQQPNGGNGYTAGIRIQDPQDGRGNYSFSLRWAH